MPENFANRYQTALAAGVTSGALTGTVTSVTGIPAYPFRAIISAEGANTDEIVLVTLVAGTTLTWTRATEAVAGVQAASAHSIGATFTAIVTAVGLLNSPGRLDIRAFGATTTSADNAVAIQAALDEQKANGGIIYIPEGTWLTSPLTYATTSAQALHIAGAGRDKSILKPKSGTGTVLTLSGPMMGSTFRGFKIDGTGGTAHGLYYSDTSDLLYESAFEDLDFSNCALQGLYLKNSFANRFVNIAAGANGHDQIKVWGGSGDYYERIDIISTVAGYGGIRSLNGGTFVGCNGIYTTASAAGPMFKFGGDGTAESDSKTVTPHVGIIGANVEAFTVTGIEFVYWNAPCRMERVSFATGSGATNVVAIQGAVSSQQPLIMVGCSFGLIGGATWKNGYAIHSGAPTYVEAMDPTEAGQQTMAYRDNVSVAYPIIGLQHGVANATVNNYGYYAATFAGATDIAYLASARLGNAIIGGYVDRTAASAMPTTGTYRRGDIVDNCSNTIAEQGGAGVKYTLTGWRRLTTGSAHVLNTDWVERRELTGN